MASSDGMMIELYAEQVRGIVERAGGNITTDGASDLAPSLRRALAEQAPGEISSALVRGLLVLAAFPADQHGPSVPDHAGRRRSARAGRRDSPLLPTGPTFRLAGYFSVQRERFDFRICLG
jgi:hypothetical protein